MKGYKESHACQVGIFFIVLYVLCIVWPMVYPYGADVLAHHLLSLKLAFPGFQGYTVGSILWGSILSFAYGYVASIAIHSLHKDCCKGK